jgi:hypothetical protein
MKPKQEIPVCDLHNVDMSLKLFAKPGLDATFEMFGCGELDCQRAWTAKDGLINYTREGASRVVK